MREKMVYKRICVTERVYKQLIKDRDKKNRMLKKLGSDTKWGISDIIKEQQKQQQNQKRGIKE